MWPESSSLPSCTSVSPINYYPPLVAKATRNATHHVGRWRRTRGSAASSTLRRYGSTGHADRSAMPSVPALKKKNNSANTLTISLKPTVLCLCCPTLCACKPVENMTIAYPDTGYWPLHGSRPRGCILHYLGGQLGLDAFKPPTTSCLAQTRAVVR